MNTSKSPMWNKVKIAIVDPKAWCAPDFYYMILDENHKDICALHSPLTKDKENFPSCVAFETAYARLEADSFHLAHRSGGFCVIPDIYMFYFLSKFLGKIAYVARVSVPGHSKVIHHEIASEDDHFCHHVEYVSVIDIMPFSNQVMQDWKIPRYHPRYLLCNTNEDADRDIQMSLWHKLLCNGQVKPTNAVFAVDLATAFGCEELLQEWSTEQSIAMMHSECECFGIDLASRFGHVNTLTWRWEESRHGHSALPFVYSTDAMDYAAAYGQLNVLTWWWTRRDLVKLKCTSKLFEWPCGTGENRVVRWIMSVWGGENAENSPCAVRCLLRSEALIWAVANRNIEAVDAVLLEYESMWYKTRNSSDSLACEKTRFYRSVIENPYIVDSACKMGHADVFSWLIKRHDPLKWKFTYTERSIDAACKHGHIEILKIWERNKDRYPLLCSARTIDFVRNTNRIDVKNWASRQGWFC